MTRQQSVAGLGCGWLGQRTGSGPRKVTGSPATAAEAEERRGRDLKRLRDVAGWIGLRLPQIEANFEAAEVTHFEADEVTDFTTTLPRAPHAPRGAARAHTYREMCFGT